MKRVLHLLRKNSQLKASFIFNQINSHIDFEPFIVFVEDRKKVNDGGFANFDLQEGNYLDLSKDLSYFENMRYKLIRSIPNRSVTKLKKFIKENKIEILHFHYGSDCGVYYSLFKELNTPSIVSFYGYDCSSFPKVFFGLGKFYLQKRVFKNVSKVLVMSEDMKSDLIKISCPENKIIVHYYGTDTSMFEYDKEYEEKKIVTLLILASLVPQKGHLFLLKAVKKLIDEGTTNFKLRIVGTGEMENELEKFVTEMNINDYVDFCGVIKYGSEEMFSEYRNADIFIHPSVIAPNGDKEGIPGTIIEAMASSLPVISTYHAGIPSIIKNSINGLLVKENVAADLALAIKSLIIDTSKRKKIGTAGKDYALSTLDLKEKEIELEKIYSSVINESK